MSEADATTTDPRGTQPAPRARSRWRFVRRAFVVLALVLVTLAVVCTRPAMLRRILQPALSTALGGPVSIEDVRLEGLSTLAVRSLTLRAPDWPGESGQIAYAEDVHVRLSLLSVLLGSPEIEFLDIGRIDLRIAEVEATPGRFNLNALSMPEGAADSALPLTTVSVRRADVTMGLAEADGAFVATATRSFTAFLKPDPNAPPDAPTKSVFLCGLDMTEGGELMRGTVDARTRAVSLTLGRLTLTKELLDLTPVAIRQTALATGLTGVIKSGSIKWSPTTPLTASVSVEDVALVPRGLALGDRWVRFQDGHVMPSRGLPKLEVNQGTISFRPNEIALERLQGVLASSANVGDLVPLPVEVSASFGLSADALRNVNWSDRTERDSWVNDFLTHTPFKVSITIRDFASNDADGKPRGVELPAQVAGAIQTFGVDRWNLEVDAEFSRAEPSRGPGGERVPAPIRSRGQALLQQASGAFDEFPYPLHDVQAHIAFDQTDEGVDRVTLDYLSGRSPAGTNVTIRGTVLYPGSEAEVALSLNAADTPIDETLFACFQGDSRRSLEELFSASAAASLRAAGLLGNAEMKVLEAKEAALLARLDALGPAPTAAETPSGTDERGRLERDLAKVRRTMQAHPFELGGRLDLDLSIARAHGADQPTIVEGTLDVRRAGVLVADFPYPLTVTQGTLALTRDGIELRGDGLHAVTLEGGAVRVTGKIGMDQAERDARVRPRIVVVGVDDEISPLLLAAIPPEADESRDGWPGKRRAATAELLAAVDLGGAIDYRIDVRGSNRAPTFDLTLSHGRIDIGEAGRAFQMPVGFTIDDVSGRVRLDGRQLRIEGFRGITDSDGGTVSLNGTIGTAAKNAPEGTATERDLTLAFDDAAIESWLVEMLPDLERTSAAALWRAIRPRGTFDATLRFVRDANGHSRVSGDITPRTIGLEVDGVSFDVQRVDGACVVDLADGVGGIRFKDLAFAIEPNADPPGGILRVAGNSHFGPETDAAPPLELAISLEGGRFESALVAASARVAGGDALAAGLATVQPVGRFDAEARVVRNHRGQWTWNTTLSPRTMQATIGDTRPTLAFDGVGNVRIGPSAVAFDRLRATVDGGTVGFNGALSLTPSLNTLNGTLSIDARRLSDAIAAFLPEPLKSAQRELAFSADELEIPDARVRVEWQPSLGITTPDVYRLDTTLTTRGGSFSVGLPLQGVDGSATIAFALESGTSAPRYTLNASMESTQLRVFDREMRDGRAAIELAPDGRTIVVRQFEGSIADGRLAGDARLDTASNRFAADVRLSDARLDPLIDPTAVGPNARNSKGTVDARLSIEGITDDVQTRTGRGRIAVRGATMASTTLTLRLVELSQLALPLDSAIRSADITFFIDGPVARFEQFRLAANNVDIDGTGYVDTRDFTINATFRSRGRVAIMSDIVGAVTDTLFEIYVTGPVANPRASLRPLPILTRPR
ncbi:MAG: hypothetical protein JNM94_01290 [Phycisphaerae bacterium]|nr:hypothetical protein [Phycisphaerae bacterium]